MMRYILIMFALAALFFNSLQAEMFYVAGRQGIDTVTFESQAKLEFVSGETYVVIGAIDFDPANPAAGATGRLRVDARTLKTGIELRDEHMRDRHLHTAQYPYVEFVLESVNGLPATLIAGTQATCQVTGDFTVHGKTHRITVPASVIWRKRSDTDQHLEIVATFPIKLDDYGVPRPKALFLKLAETLDIRVRIIAATTNPPVTF